MIEMTIIDDRIIVVKGIGKAFYQEGFPITMGMSELMKQEYPGYKLEISMFHIAEECFNHGWSAETVYQRLTADLQDNIDDVIIDEDKLKEFIFAEYEEQRQMIFDYFFVDVDHAMGVMRDKLLTKCIVEYFKEKGLEVKVKTI